MTETYRLSHEAAEAYESTFVPALFREWANRLVDFAGIADGPVRPVLDVACGTGIVARTAADRLGASATLLGSYFAVGEPDLLHQIVADAGLRITRFVTWQGATRLPSIDVLLSVELLPLAGKVPADVRERIAQVCRIALQPFVDGSGGVAAPIEVHLVAARVG